MHAPIRYSLVIEIPDWHHLIPKHGLIVHLAAVNGTAKPRPCLCNIHGLVCVAGCFNSWSFRNAIQFVSFHQRNNHYQGQEKTYVYLEEHFLRKISILNILKFRLYSPQWNLKTARIFIFNRMIEAIAPHLIVWLI